VKTKIVTEIEIFFVFILPPRHNSARHFFAAWNAAPTLATYLAHWWKANWDRFESNQSQWISLLVLVLPAVPEPDEDFHA
jgi:hypothetical protein